MYDIHLTVSNEDQTKVSMFRALCKDAGIKTVVYENGWPAVDTHVMTCAKAETTDEVALTIKKIENIAQVAGTAVLRKKVEGRPQPGEIISGNDYLEVHVSVTASTPDEIPYDRNVWAVSRNIEHEPGNWALTMRSRNTNLDAFKKEILESMMGFFGYIVTGKHIYYEKAIMDTNPELDKAWMPEGRY